MLVVALIVGYAVGAFALANIILPLLWVWPKARRLTREGRLIKPIPTIRFLVAPLFWTILVGGSIVLAAAVFSESLVYYLVGLGANLIPILRLVTKPNEHMEADFADTYGCYLQPDVIEKHAAAVMKIVANLCEQPELSHGDAPKVLRSELPDSRFRYLMFCLSTVHFVCAHQMKDPNTVLGECAKHVVGVAVSSTGADGFFSGPVDQRKISIDATDHLNGFLKQWSSWLDATRRDPGNARAGTSVVCSMLRKTESSAPPIKADEARLWPLACWLEDSIPAIGSAFVKLGSVELTEESRQGPRAGDTRLIESGHRVPLDLASSRLVLVVEDDVDSRRSLVKVLEMHGFSVVTAETAEVAFDLLRQNNVVAALVDLRLQNGSAGNVVLSSPGNIPVIILSGPSSDTAELSRFRPEIRVCDAPPSLVQIVEMLDEMLAANPSP